MLRQYLMGLLSGLRPTMASSRASQSILSRCCVQARTRWVVRALAHNADDAEFVDMATVSGYGDFRRLRPATGWPLLTLQSYGDDRDSIGLNFETQSVIDDLAAGLTASPVVSLVDSLAFQQMMARIRGEFSP